MWSTLWRTLAISGVTHTAETSITERLIIHIQAINIFTKEKKKKLHTLRHVGSTGMRHEDKHTSCHDDMMGMREKHRHQTYWSESDCRWWRTHSITSSRLRQISKKLTHEARRMNYEDSDNQRIEYQLQHAKRLKLSCCSPQTWTLTYYTWLIYLTFIFNFYIWWRIHSITSSWLETYRNSQEPKISLHDTRKNN